MNFEITKQHYINRDLSWLDFNARVLEEAGDKSNPPIERLKFIAIFSNNLDEFFMVRVAGLRQQLDAGDKGTDPSGMPVATQLSEIRKKLLPLLDLHSRFLKNDILPELESKGIKILQRENWTPVVKKDARDVFDRQIFPVLTPIAIDPSHPFPVINSGAIEIAVKMKHFQTGKDVIAFVEVPSVLPRFILISSSKENEKTYILLEDIIIENISELFKDCEIIESMLFRITRDMDFTIDEEGVSDLLSHIEKALLHRRRREPIRLELLKEAANSMESWLAEQLGLLPDDIYHVDCPLHCANFFQLVCMENRPGLVEEPWTPLPNPLITDKESIFDSVKKNGDIPIYLPFQSFDPVVRLLEEAADDPNVLAIKQTLYRVSGDSPVVNALIKAAKNKKQVTVIVELKARFDEEHNIQWARQLEESGAHVIYGIAGLKIHAKALLIIRREEGMIKRYVHLSTGNYNEKTAKIYTDIGIICDDIELCTDIAALFNVMTGYSAKPRNWNKVAVAPFDLREKFISLIDREARLSSPHNPGRIIAKMNSLVHAEVIEHLYAAAHAGVKIDLIVRGQCSLKPGIGTDNIKVISIVDRYLEHSRIYYFANGGNEEFYLSSADWMPRNLHRRIEILFPVENKNIRKTLMEILQLQLEDKFKSRILQPDGSYTPSGDTRFIHTRSQKRTYELFKKMTPSSMPRPTKLKILDA